MTISFADEALNKRFEKISLDRIGRIEIHITTEIRLVIYALDNLIEFGFYNNSFGKIASKMLWVNGSETCYTNYGHHSRNMSSPKLMEHLMSISDNLGEWLLWNQIL